MYSRRSFLKISGACSVSCLLPIFPMRLPAESKVMTVMGDISSQKLGITLPHEHVLVDFIGAGEVSPDRYDAGVAFQKTLPYLEEIKKLGCQSFVECTPNYLGRDVKLLRRLSEATGLQILTNTGYYGARDGAFLPDHVATESAGQLAHRWVQEFRNGIDGTDIRPGFIKIGMCQE